MSTTLPNINGDQFKEQKNTSNNKLIQSYLDFCDRQMKHRMVWFFFLVLILPCFFMPLAIFAIFSCGGGTGTGFMIYTFVSMMLFILGMAANVGDQNTRVTISIFVIAVLWNIFYPLIFLSVI